MAPPPALPEELVEAILLRFPPDEPACLVRAVLVCKPWCRLISGPGFRRRYRRFHRSPPLLGFFSGIFATGGIEISRFVPASTFRSPLADLRHCCAVDAHHGRVLLRCPGKASSENVFVVWDPTSDERRELPMLARLSHRCRWDWNAAIVCAADGPSDHLDCHREPFLIVFVDTHSQCHLSISTYSSDAGTWSDRVFPHQPLHAIIINLAPCAHVGNALYFSIETPGTALKYDLCLREVSAIQLPPTPDNDNWRPHVLTSTEDGDLGCVTVHEFKLYLWSRKDGPQVDAGWTQNRVIDIEMLLQSNAILTSPSVVGFANGIGVVFLRKGGLIFTVDLKTKNLKKLSEGTILHNILPYMSFYTPALEQLVGVMDQVQLAQMHESSMCLKAA